MSRSFCSALLVEDEVNLARAISIALKKLGISLKHATTLAQARDLFSQSTPELIVLDRRLPDGDGIEFCRETRARGYHGVILMLTAQGQVEDRVEGLTAGADDYLAKPFSWEELHARIIALSRRHFSPRPNDTKSPDPWDMDENRLRIQGPKGWAELTPLEFKLASHLMSAHGAIVSRESLLKHVWGFTLLPKTRTVDHFLGRLRKLFETNPEEPKHFITVRGAGYRFEK